MHKGIFPANDWEATFPYPPPLCSIGALTAPCSHIYAQNLFQKNWKNSFCIFQATHEWFKLYKIPAGKPENEFAFNGEAKDREFALKTVLATHEHWKRLVNDNNPNIDDISR